MIRGVAQGSYPYEQRDFSGSAELYTVEYRLFQYCLHWKCPYHGHSLISLDIWDIYPIWKADLRLCLTSPMYLQAQHKHRTQIYCCGTQQSSTSMFTREKYCVFSASKGGGEKGASKFGQIHPLHMPPHHRLYAKLIYFTQVGSGHPMLHSYGGQRLQRKLVDLQCSFGSLAS